jgi:hypothetical protein
LDDRLLRRDELTYWNKNAAQRGGAGAGAYLVLGEIGNIHTWPYEAASCASIFE